MEPGVATAVGRVRAACGHIEEDGGSLDLSLVAKRVHCSPRQLQRDFLAVVGVTPRQYAQAVRSSCARSALRQEASVGDAIQAAGYGSVRAFYEEAARRLGMTPGTYASGAPLPLLWSVGPTAVGQVIVVASAEGLCSVQIVQIGADAGVLEQRIREEFPRAELVQDDAAMADVMTALRALARGVPLPHELPIDVTGTVLQAKVWSALRRIPPGQTRSYAELAAEIGEPTAVRAVASACGRNRVAMAIPCHRVIRGDGSLAGYAWGLEVKAMLLDAEGSVPLPG